MVRLRSALLIIVALLAVAAPAHAWVEHAVKSDSVTLDVEHDGRAVVTHEMLLWVRGGPLPEVSVEPIDADAELLDGATVTRAESGRAAGLPVPLASAKDAAHLTLRIVGEKGLRSGTYQIRFAYRTDLAAAGHLHPSAAGTVLEWTGPSFADGIDSARVVFRVPTGPTPPRLGSGDSGGAEGALADETGGVFLATFRRAADKDELEVVRPHVAKNEIVSWRITTDASIFDVAGSRATVAPVPAVPAPGHAAYRHARTSPLLLAIVALLSLLFGASVVQKSRWVAAACREHRATPRPLVPLATPLRAALATSGLAFAVALVVVSAPRCQPWQA